MLTIDELSVTYPKQLCLEFSAKEQQQAWPDEIEFSNNAARWNAYLNRLCLQTLKPWLLLECEVEPKVGDKVTHSIIWEVVNGTAITIGETRIVLIPNEVGNTEEFSVPQEWVDLSSWCGNYYLAVQVNPDDCWVRVWGYATHQQLKEQAYYDDFTQSYLLERKNLIEDLNVMWVALSLGANEKLNVNSVPSLSLSEEENLLQQLSQPSAYSPRLEVEFEKWGALLENERLRQRLYQQRLLNSQSIVSSSQAETLTHASQALVNLSQWFENVVSAGWQTIEDFISSSESQLTLAWRNRGEVDERPRLEALIEQVYRGQTDHQRKQAARTLGEMGIDDAEAVAALIHLINTTQDEETRWVAAESLWLLSPGNPNAGVRRITDLGMQFGDRTVALMVALLEKGGNQVAILLRLYPLKNQRFLPANLQLIVLDESGETFLEAQARDADNYIQLKFSGDRGERFSVQVALNEASLTEDFLI